MGTEAYKEVILEAFPCLKDGGEFQFLRGISNTRSMEVLSIAVHKSPGDLKQRVGNSRTYLRPMQRDLPTDMIGMVSVKILKNG
ncbi:MAG: hypothetical protein A6F71_07490 [Cycloclasticus sp. symbiont of Poecilosclerida sp. M]|nr:MAG: hypothetical protein A6F71_07490 [Cycloclasticus sp. symbiont of Poecilosclerida sp. M]